MQLFRHQVIKADRELAREQWENITVKNEIEPDMRACVYAPESRWIFIIQIHSQ